MDKEDELRHLRVGPRPGEEPRGVWIRSFTVRCDGDAARVLTRCKDVLRVVVEPSSKEVSLEEWRRLLPDWFVAACAEERTQEEEERLVERWRRLSKEEKLQHSKERVWTLSGWIYWFEEVGDIERLWFWGDGIVENPDTVNVDIEIWDWPLPVDSLYWLLKSSGARSVHDAF